MAKEKDDRLKTLENQLHSASKTVDELAAQLQSSEDRCKGSEVQLE
jgi:uncharacterized coiled-coil protein SlyX